MEGPEFSERLADLQAGDPQSLEQLTPVLYAELRRIARRVWGCQDPGHTPQPTVLIHEAYLKLVHQKDRSGWDLISLTWWPSISISPPGTIRMLPRAPARAIYLPLRNPHRASRMQP
ncbi:MAG TPA: ECF-type sigma factor [Candidatus Limnocylindrales bacterium]|nr:ECF-type sigma factor [Candidatus Limnocylindrales bacterium]